MKNSNFIWEITTFSLRCQDRRVLGY